MSNTRTPYGSVAQVAAWLGAPIPSELMEGTLINTKLQIRPNDRLGTNELPRILGFMLGTGGLNYSTATNGRTRQHVTPHLATDGAPFEMLPVCIREVGNDLTASERQRYGLRRLETIAGVNYIVYYLYRHSFRNAPIKVERRTTVNGTTTPSAFVPDSKVLSPVPTVVATENVNPLKGQLIVASARLEITLDAFAVNEIIQAAVILYGSENDAYVTELMMVQGVERNVDGQTGVAGGTLNYAEVICAQAGQHITSRIFFPDFREGWDTAFELGGADPMFEMT